MEPGVIQLRVARFKRVASFNPYWDAQGATFEDPDGYRTVLQQASWPGSGMPPAAPRTDAPVDRP